ncbi:CU044_2847 family protein [Rhodobacter lacus]|uniref:CU044_2847 family protein n=1 Tax=Rhodobacter lacus TaxID=1641972 RepID=A0ABW5ABC8_9RHOB
MATKIQMFELKSGARVAVEVPAEMPADPGDQMRSFSRTERIADALVEETGQRFSEALEGVQEAAQEILQGFAKSLAPDELKLSFGLKFSAATGVVLASADAEATLTLSATWTKPKPAT